VELLKSQILHSVSIVQVLDEGGLHERSYILPSNSNTSGIVTYASILLSEFYFRPGFRVLSFSLCSLDIGLAFLVPLYNVPIFLSSAIPILPPHVSQTTVYD